MPRRIKRVAVNRDQLSLPNAHVYSFSQLNKHLNCGHSYKLKYVDKVEIVSVAPPMIFGSKMHKYYEGVLNARLQDHEMTNSKRAAWLQESIIDLEDEIKKQTNNYCEVNKVKEANVPFKFNIDHLKIQFKDLATLWNKEILPDIDPVAVEKELRIKLIDNIEFIMYIDLIRTFKKSQQIVDWKISKKSKGESLTNSSLQLSTYALATGINNVAFCSIIRPEYTNKWAPRIEMNQATRHPKELEWAGIVIKDTVKAIESGSFPKCSPENFLCSESFCDYWKICRGKYVKPATKSPSWMSHG